MSLTKYASLESAQVLELKSSPTKEKTASLARLADFHDYRTEDGYLYARIRAISSRTNKNHDGWPTIELAGGPEEWEKESSRHEAAEGGFTVQASKGKKYGFSTFLGKPHFVDHHNSDPKRARGVVVDASFHVLDQKTAAADDDYWGSDSVDPEHFPPAEVELLIEVDAKTFPKLAKAIVNGDIDGFSMGCDVDYSKCSHCGHKASSPDEYCSHVQAKGAEFDFTSKDGKTSSRKSYENCYGIKFFEISAVFDPADETALAKEIHAEGKESKTAGIEDEQYLEIPCPHCGARGRLHDTSLGTAYCNECGHSEKLLDPSGQVQGGDGAYSQEPKRVEYATPPKELVIGAPGVTPRYQGSYLSSKIGSVKESEYKYVKKHGDKWVIVQKGTGKVLSTHDSEEKAQSAFRAMEMNMHGGATKTAQPEEPQSDHVRAPEEVNTMREEKVCPLCGSDMEDGKCDVCGYDEPPESMQNPDLSKAKEQVEDLENQEGVEQSPDLQTAPPGPNEQPDATQETYLNARNPKPASTVNSEMRWAPQIELPKISASGPKGDEPEETVISDQTTPVTSALRTAKELIQAAKRNQKGNTMSDDVKKVAADPADPSAAAKKQVDVTGVGGVDDASAEAASKADTQTDVTGKGGIINDSNAEASKPSDGTDSLPSGDQDNAGFQPGGETGDPTKTFDNSNEPDSAVTDKPFIDVVGAVHGTQPADPIGKAGDRIDVETPPHDQVGPETDTWSGTSGNGVTKQQDAVTNVPTQSGGVKASGTISLAALKLADAEVELGLTQKDDKYNRLAELAEMPEDEIAAEHRALAKVKTAGLSRTASKGASRLPSFQRIASEETPAPQPVDDALLDSALYN